MTVSFSNSKPRAVAKNTVLAIGAGPSNLSLAALADPVSGVDVIVLECRDEIRWHPGLQIADAELQVSFLKDLVTLVDPTSRFSFLSFLKAEKRMYRALVANRDYTSRLEFERYLRWVAENTRDIRTSTEVHAMSYDEDGLWLDTSQGPLCGTDVVVGVGRKPRIPDIPGASAVGSHASSYLYQGESPDYSGRRVAVIGGGQSGAEVVSDLLRRHGANISILWVCKRMNLLPLDDTPFINEQFFPNYIDYFSSLAPDQRNILNTQFRCASDGISERTLSQLYRQLYDLECVQQNERTVDILVSTKLVRVLEGGGTLQLTLRDELVGTSWSETCDDIIYATGYEFRLPDFVQDCISGPLEIREDRSVVWDAPDRFRLFLQNSSVEQFGLAEPNLSLLAWRSARILNTICETPPYCLEQAPSALGWVTPQDIKPLKASNQ